MVGNFRIKAAKAARERGKAEKIIYSNFSSPKFQLKQEFQNKSR